MMTSGGLMARTNAEIRAALESHEVRRSERARLRRPIALIDGLINDLEELHLKRVSRVPLSYEGRLLQLRIVLGDSAVPSGDLDKLKARTGVVKIMDQLYEIQDDVRLNPSAQPRPRSRALTRPRSTA
jgi:hypothetical protein